MRRFYCRRGSGSGAADRRGGSGGGGGGVLLLFFFLPATIDTRIPVSEPTALLMKTMILCFSIWMYRVKMLILYAFEMILFMLVVIY